MIMFSSLFMDKDDGYVESVDTERLLNKGQWQEQPIRSSARHKNSSIKHYLHLGAVLVYGAVTILLYTWSRRLYERQSNLNETSISSPATKAVVYRKQSIYHNVADHNKYRGPPRPEQDAAWKNLLQYNNLRIQEEDLTKANVTSVPLNDEKGGYLVTLDVFHTLHCVNKIRKLYYSDYYHNPNPLADQQEHFDHCIDLLRQTLMCHGDVSLHTYRWKDDYRWPWPTMQTEHQCRDWDRLMDWSKEHHIPSLTGPILSHPSLGISYRGDEPHD